MYNYYYTYEAYFMFGDISLRLSETYISVMGALTWLAIFAAFACVLFSAIANKKGRVLGCITALAAPLSIFAAHNSVVNYAQLNFSSLSNLRATSSISTADAISKLSEMLIEEFCEEILVHPAFLAYLFWAVVSAVATIITIVYSIILIKSRRGKGLAVGALILLIVKFIFISPVQSITGMAGYLNIDLADLFGPLAYEIQLFWELFFLAATLLPLLLIAIQALLCLVNKKKDAAIDAANAEAAANANVNYAAPNYNPNAAYNPNANYNPNVNYNPNANYNPNVNYNPNTNYNPNVNYDPNTNYNPNVNNNNNNQG